MTVENTKGHVIVIARTNDSCLMTITTVQLSKEDAAKDFEQNCRDLCKGLIDTARGSYKLTESKLSFKTVDGRKTGEEAFSIASARGVVHGFVRCWIVNGRVFNWTALATDGPVEKQKDILDITGSIKFVE